MITGTVTDSKTQETLPGANIVLLDSNSKPVLTNGFYIGTTTNANGVFSSNKIAVGNKIQVSFMGYNPVIIAAQSVNNIKLTENNTQLSEVTITGEKPKTSKASFIFPIALLLLLGYAAKRAY